LLHIPSSPKGNKQARYVRKGELAEHIILKGDIKLMSSVKTFRLTGEIKAPHMKSSFNREVRAMSQEDAKDNVYKTLGGKHKLKRYMITFTTAEELPAQEEKT